MHHPMHVLDASGPLPLVVAGASAAPLVVMVVVIEVLVLIAGRSPKIEVGERSKGTPDTRLY